jgi:hypothetical protein
MRDAVETELLDIARSIAFAQAGSVTLSDRTASHSATPANLPMPGVAPALDSLAAQLQQLLYHWRYCRPFEQASSAPTPPPTADPKFVEDLAAANGSRERWDAGWQTQQILPNGQTVILKGAMTRTVWPGEFLAHGAAGGPPRPGTAISVLVSRESRTMQPGFYFAFGEALGDQEDEFSLVRLYWHVGANGAAALIGGITRALNRFAVPFRCKTLAMPTLYDRADAAVLYVAKRHYRIAAQLLADLYPALRSLLEPETPLFTKRLADGVGLAESPKSGESFGMHRCRIVAEAICNAHARGLDAPEARVQEIVDAFSKSGLTLEHPFLNPGSIDQYGFLDGEVG